MQNKLIWKRFQKICKQDLIKLKILILEFTLIHIFVTVDDVLAESDYK